ncbi:MAG TPA: tetratricopeptide repeat protein [Candidatus Acidoferrum sp.]|nr:tetratricopeptide repeat protein [Candidatus Acidoferrum sp.]
MFRFVAPVSLLVFGLTALPAVTLTQSASKQPAIAPPVSLQTGLDLAGSGHCAEALPLLKRFAPHTTDKQLKLKGGLATVRCALSVSQVESAVDALLWLNREYPDDPEVLYVTAHAYSDLSSRASMRLVQTGANSIQAHELNAEALEVQGKWDGAEREYREILKQNPRQTGIHFRLGRLLLSKPNPEPSSVQEAKQEFQDELALDPKNAGAEYVLGELDRQAGDLSGAVEHFSRASHFDASLANAFLGLGMVLIADGKAAEAIPPLEKYVKMEPANPGGHYQLALAYNRVGRREDAKREATLQKTMAEKLEQEKQKAAAVPPDHPVPQSDQKPQ